VGTLRSRIHSQSISPSPASPPTQFKERLRRQPLPIRLIFACHAARLGAGWVGRSYHDYESYRFDNSTRTCFHGRPSSTHQRGCALIYAAAAPSPLNLPTCFTSTPNLNSPTNTKRAILIRSYWSLCGLQSIRHISCHRPFSNKAAARVTHIYWAERLATIV
jgi:hypothetical protein